MTKKVTLHLISIILVYISSSSPGRQSWSSLYDNFTQKMVLKRLLISDMGKSPRKQNSSGWYGSFTQMVVLKKAFIIDTWEDSVLHIHCSCLLGDRGLLGSRVAFERWSLLFISDTEKAFTCSYRSHGRQSIWMETELYDSIELYSKDGLEKAIHHKEASACLFRSPRRQSSMIQ